MDEAEEWAEDEEVSFNTYAKIQAIKLLRYRCLAKAGKSNALEVATPVLKMLVTLLEHGGTFTPDTREEYARLSSVTYFERSRPRLMIAQK